MSMLAIARSDLIEAKRRINGTGFPIESLCGSFLIERWCGFEDGFHSVSPQVDETVEPLSASMPA